MGDRDWGGHGAGMKGYLAYQKDLGSQLTAAQNEEANLKAARGREKEGTEEYKKLTEALEKAGEKVKGLETAIQGNTDAARDYMQPLTEATTRATASLKDFVGSEDTAKRLLSALTGGQPGTSESAANKVDNDMAKLAILTQRSGLQTEVVGQLLQGNYQAFAAKSGDPTGRSTANAAFAYTMDMMSHVANMGGDPEKISAFMDAAQKRGVSLIGSKADRFSVLMQDAINKGGFAGDPAALAKIKDLATSGDPAKFNQAVKLLASATGTSIGDIRAMMNDTSMLNKIRSGFTSEQSAQQIDLLTGIAHGDDSRIQAESELAGRTRQLRGQLGSAGISQRAISERMGSASYSAARAHLAGGRREGESEEDFRKRRRALSAFDRERETLLQQYKGRGYSADRINQMAWERAQSSGLFRGLSSEEQAALRDAAGKAGNAALEHMGDFSTGNRADGSAGASFLGAVGAIGSDGKISRTAVGTVGQNLFSTMLRLGRHGGLVGKDGKPLNSRAIRQLRTKFRQALSSSDGSASVDILSQALGMVGGDGADLLKDQLSGVFAPSTGGKGVFADRLAQQNAARRRGMSTGDSMSLDAGLTTPASQVSEEQVGKYREQTAKAAEAGQTGDIQKLFKFFESGDTKELLGAFKNVAAPLASLIGLIQKIVEVFGDAKVVEGLKTALDEVAQNTKKTAENTDSRTEAQPS